MCTLVLPQALQGLARGSKALQLSGGTVAEVFDALAVDHPTLARRIRDEQGGLRRFVNVYVDGTDVRHAAGLGTEVGPDAEILVLPSVAGG